MRLERKSHFYGRFYDSQRREFHKKTYAKRAAARLIPGNFGPISMPIPGMAGLNPGCICLSLLLRGRSEFTSPRVRGENGRPSDAVLDTSTPMRSIGYAQRG
jgi:hypothetical protein